MIAPTPAMLAVLTALQGREPREQKAAVGPRPPERRS